MRIENLRSEKNGDRPRVAANVIWEDYDRPPYELYFETPNEFAQDLFPNPHAFLIACAIPAMHYGEERLFIDSEICPELLDGLTVAMSWLCRWFTPDCKPMRIDAKPRSYFPETRTPERAGLFFSGGIDSLATLRANRLHFPLEHPWSIKDGIVVYGLELDEPQKFEYVVNTLSDIAKDAEITLIPVYTNLYLHFREEDSKDGFSFWWYKFMGAALSAVAHIFAKRLTVISIASDSDIRPHGSHSLIDPNYSCVDLRIRHDGVSMSRFRKTQLVAEWNMALQRMRVCNQYRRYQPNVLNCGKCEKCVRTMLELLSIGVLDKTRAFPSNDVPVELVWSAINIGYISLPYYEELMPALIEKDRHDLVRAIEEKMAEYHKFQMTGPWRKKVRELDKKYTKGRLLQVKRALFS